MRKNKIYLIGSLLLAFMMAFTACEEDEYDFDAIDPEILAMDGPDVLIAHGSEDFPTQYKVPYRGGSTWDWSGSSPSGEPTIIQDEELGNIAYITFPTSSEQAEGSITVVETTYGGMSSDPFTKPVTLTPFCPEDMNPWAGTWYSDNPLDAAELEAEVDETALNTLIIDGFILALVEDFWEETIIEGVGGEGKTTIEFDCDNTINVDEQLLLETAEWGEYWIRGEGEFDPDNETMTITYDIYWAPGGDAWDTFTSVLTREEPKKTDRSDVTINTLKK